jgi:signal transduction histidine kinase
VRSNPELVEQALSTIEEMASQAVSELRRLLVVLRAVVQEPDEEAETGRRLGELEHLRRETELAGVQVHIAVQGNLSTLDPSLDLTAYRILQEALTNVTRHAGTGSVVDVRLSLTSDCLVVEVSNTQGAATPDAAIGLSSGFGLVGLRERVSLAGGDLEVSARPTARWSPRSRAPGVAAFQRLGDSRTRPLWYASATAWLRSLEPVFIRIRETWVRTVASLMVKWALISALDLP